jgi:hypothetical protein
MIAKTLRFAQGIPPHTFAEETVIDLVHAAANLDDVIACVTGGFARNLVRESPRAPIAPSSHGPGGDRPEPPDHA